MQPGEESTVIHMPAWVEICAAGSITSHLGPGDASIGRQHNQYAKMSQIRVLVLTWDLGMWALAGQQG